MWPLSRLNKPKQMLALDSDRTLFQQAVDRLAGIFPAERILVVTVERQVAELQAEVPEIPLENFLQEPFPRGTASVVGLAASILLLRDPQAVMAVLTADHMIGNIPLFQKLLPLCYEAALKNTLVTLGILPDYASTGYGYLQRGDSAGFFLGTEAFQVLRFKEKPDLETAQKFIAAGDHYWNSGMFFWKAEAILEEFKKQMPDLFTSLDRIRLDWKSDQRMGTLKSEWEKIVPQTIDFGIMENAGNVIVIPAPDLHWNDVGSWDSLFNVLAPDEDGNIFLTDTSRIGDINDSILYEANSDKLIAAIGLKDMVIIDTVDALFICPRGETQKVRDLVINLKNQGFQRYL